MQREIHLVCKVAETLGSKLRNQLIEALVTILCVGTHARRVKRPPNQSSPHPPTGTVQRTTRSRVAAMVGRRGGAAVRSSAVAISFIMSRRNSFGKSNVKSVFIFAYSHRHPLLNESNY